MGSRIRKMPSASMVVAFVALLAALGGTAYAARQQHRDKR
jgi:hypothetical protein